MTCDIWMYFMILNVFPSNLNLNPLSRDRWLVADGSLALGSRHKISYMWLVQGGLGLVGASDTIATLQIADYVNVNVILQVGMALNSFVLYVFYNDRQHLNTSVNTMTRCSELTGKKVCY